MYIYMLFLMCYCLPYFMYILSAVCLFMVVFHLYVYVYVLCYYLHASPQERAKHTYNKHINKHQQNNTSKNTNT